MSKFIAVIFVTLSFATFLPAQSSPFPEGSSQGRTEMDSSLRPMETPRAPVVPNVDISITQPQSGKEVAFSVQLLVLLTVLTLAPSILILTTCFLRFSIVLDFIKRALSLQQVPPTAVLNGIAFFMTIFVMWPTFNRVYTDAFKPMQDGSLSIQEAVTQAGQPIRKFMFTQLDSPNNKRTIALFMNMAKLPQPKSESDVPNYVLIPSYILSELTIAFRIGIMLYIPFIVIDMVVASILMSMGMMMLPPVQISMPFKLMLFVLVDGWGLLTRQLFLSVAH